MLKTVKTLLRKLDMRILSKLLVIHQTDVDKKITMVINELLSLTIRSIVDGKKYEKE